MTASPEEEEEEEMTLSHRPDTNAAAPAAPSARAADLSPPTAAIAATPYPTTLISARAIIAVSWAIIRRLVPFRAATGRIVIDFDSYRRSSSSSRSSAMMPVLVVVGNPRLVSNRVARGATISTTTTDGPEWAHTIRDRLIEFFRISCVCEISFHRLFL